MVSTAHQNDRPMSLNVCGSTIRTSTPPTTTITIATSTIERIARASVRRSIQMRTRVRSDIDRGAHEGPPRPSDTAERIAGAILAFRPGALFVFDTR